MPKPPAQYKLLMTDFLGVNNACNVYWYDRDNNLLHANDHMLTMIGSLLGIEDITELKERALDLVDKDVIIAENQQVLATGQAKQFFNRLKINNTLIIFVTIKTPFYNDNNEIAGVFGLSHILSTYELDENNPEKLTARESECLMELIKGKTAAQIAETLSLSKRTVESYLDNIKGKLGCRSKSELLDKVYQAGLASLIEEKTTSEPFKPGVFLPKDHDKEK